MYSNNWYSGYLASYFYWLLCIVDRHFERCLKAERGYGFLSFMPRETSVLSQVDWLATGLKHSRWWIDWSCVQIQGLDPPKDKERDYVLSCPAQKNVIEPHKYQSSGAAPRHLEKSGLNQKKCFVIQVKDCSLWRIWTYSIGHSMTQSEYVATCLAAQVSLPVHICFSGSTHH